MSDLEKEEKLKAAIEARMGGAVSDVVIQRKNRLWLDIKPENLNDFLIYMKDEMAFKHMATITGLDLGEQLCAVYHLTDTHMLVNIRARTPRTAPELPTVTGVFPGCEAYERELEDMFGIKIKGLKPGRRYPLPDDFPADQHPLRKDWKVGDVYPEEQAPQTTGGQAASAPEAK